MNTTDFDKKDTVPGIIIEVRGGNVIEVYATSPSATVMIVDWDNSDPKANLDILNVIKCKTHSEIPPETLGALSQQ